MGLRFRKSFKVAPGVKVNLNKKSAGITLGTKGAHFTVNTSGKRTASVGIPGTGLSYSTSSGGKKKGTKGKPASKRAAFQKWIGILIAVIAVISVILALKGSLGQKADSTVSNTGTAVTQGGGEDVSSGPDGKDTVSSAGTSDTAETVWISQSGSKYHSKPDCSGMEGATEVTLEEALEMGKEACKRCY